MANPFAKLNTSAERSTLLQRPDVSYVIYDKPIEQIHEDDNNPRLANNPGFSPEALANLADDIKERGIQNALVVRPHPEIKGEFMVISGHRRLRAAKLAGLTKVPVRISESKTYEEDQIAENLQRENLTALEFAAVIGRYQDQGLKTREIAQQLHISQTKATFYCNFNKAPEPLRGLVTNDDTGIADSVETVNYLISAYRINSERVLQMVADARRQGRKISVKDAQDFKRMVKEEHDAAEVARQNAKAQEELEAAVDAAAGVAADDEAVEDASRDDEIESEAAADETPFEDASESAPRYSSTERSAARQVEASDDSEDLDYAPAEEADDAEEASESDEVAAETKAEAEEDVTETEEAEDDRGVFDYPRILPRNLLVIVDVNGKEAILKPYRKADKPGHVLVQNPESLELSQVALPLKILRIEDSSKVDQDADE